MEKYRARLIDCCRETGQMKRGNSFVSEPGQICPGSLCHSPTVGIGLGEMNKNFNLGRNFLTGSDKAFILHMCIPYDKTFHIVL